MKLKYFLKGFGAGVLFATIILSIALLFRPEQKRELTDAEIIVRARELGMEMAGDGDDGTTEAVQDETESVTEKPEETAASKDSREEETSGREAVSEAETEFRETPDSSADSDNTKVVIEIAKGMNAETVSRILQEAEVVESASDLSYYLMLKGKTRIIRAGTFEFTRGMSFEDIEKAICVPEE